MENGNGIESLVKLIDERFPNSKLSFSWLQPDSGIAMHFRGLDGTTWTGLGHFTIEVEGKPVCRAKLFIDIIVTPG